MTVESFLKKIISRYKEKKNVKKMALAEADKIADKLEKQPSSVVSTKIPWIATYGKDPDTLTEEEKKKIHLRRNIRKQVVKTRINQFKNK